MVFVFVALLIAFITPNETVEKRGLEFAFLFLSSIFQIFVLLAQFVVHI